MPVFSLPITSDPGLSYEIPLLEIKYLFQILWNEPDKSWYLSVYLDSELLIGSIRLVYGIDLIEFYQLELPGRMALTATRQVGDDRLARDTGKPEIEENLFLLYDTEQ